MAASQPAAAPVFGEAGTHRPVPPSAAMEDYQFIEVFKPQHKVRYLCFRMQADLVWRVAHASALLCKLWAQHVLSPSWQRSDVQTAHLISKAVVWPIVLMVSCKQRSMNMPAT